MVAVVMVPVPMEVLVVAVVLVMMMMKMMMPMMITMSATSFCVSTSYTGTQSHLAHNQHSKCPPSHCTCDAMSRDSLFTVES